MFSFQHPIALLPKHSKLVHGFIHVSEGALSITIPQMIIFMILDFYGITVEICKWSPQKKRLKSLIPMKTKKCYDVYFHNIEFKQKLIIGLVSNNNILKPFFKLHQAPLFSGIVLVKNGHCFYEDGILMYKEKTFMDKQYSLKMTINFSLERRINYEINSGPFTHQFITSGIRKVVKSKQIFASSRHAYFFPVSYKAKVNRQEQIKEQLQQKYFHFCIQLFDVNDKISITNIIKY